MEFKKGTKEDYARRINLLTQYIEGNLDSTIDIGILAEIAGFSKWHFHRISRALLGEPVGSYITRIRLETAARMLRMTDLPISDICYKVGYDSPSGLSKGFRQYYGISPSSYRKNKDFVIMKPTQITPELDITMSREELNDINVAYLRIMGEYNSIDYMAAWGILHKFLDEHTLISDHQFICIYHDDPKITDPSKLRTDICLTVDHAFKPEGEVGYKTIAGGTYAIFLYKGPYSDLDKVYDTIYGKMIPESNMIITDRPGFEKYLNSPMDTSPADLLTQIFVPVR